MKLSRIPYDAVVLATVVQELQRFQGARIQNAWQPDEFAIVLELYSGGGESYLLLSADPIHARAHLTAARGRNQEDPTPFLSAIRSNLVGRHIDAVCQVQGDRILAIEAGDLTLFAELMGKHSNLILVQNGRVIDAAKRIGASKSSRLILPGKPFTGPPSAEGHSSPFFARLQAAGSMVQANVLAPGYGAYPYRVTVLGYEEIERMTLNLALDQHFAAEIPKYRTEQLKSSLLGQLRRVALAREAALHELDQAAESGGLASRWQQMGELLLAYATQIEPEVARFEPDDYNGNPILIKLDPEKTAIENANRYFEKAKKGKARLPMIEDQQARLRAEHEEIEGAMIALEEAHRLDEVERLQELAKARKWLNRPNLGQVEKEERPYAGHRIREMLAPHGFTVLYGENAAANDYLTMRVGKPDDWWLHVRGGVSAHAIIQTGRRPEKVPTETLLFAARIVMQNSVMKHASYVPVDYTLKKYVRKPRGSKAGTVVYTHEKTLYID